MNSGKRLSELLDLFDISASEMSRATGIPKSSISMWMNGERTMRQDKIDIISSYYHVDPAWLMGYDVPMHRDTEQALEQLKQLSGDERMELSGMEVAVIKAFRDCDEIDRISVLRTLKLDGYADFIRNKLIPDEDDNAKLG